MILVLLTAIRGFHGPTAVLKSTQLIAIQSLTVWGQSGTPFRCLTYD
jgi:hypothetical protein